MSRSSREAERDIQLGLYETTGAGYGLIINIVNFVPSHLSTRDGSDKDAKKVRGMLMERDFTVDCVTYCTAGQIRAHLEMIGKDQNRYRCLFVLILSHGYQNGIYGSDGECLSFNEIQSYLIAASCPAFKNKPKLVFVQSCRRGSVEAPSEDVIVLEEDIHLSTAGQLYSETYRDPVNGSFYIQCLLKVIEESGDEEDLASLLPKVTALMVSNKLPLPYNRDLLRGKVYLRRNRRSKMIVRRESQCSRETQCSREQVVTPTLSIPSPFLRPPMSQFPRMKRKRSRSPSDDNGVEIEKPFPKSFNADVSCQNLLQLSSTSSSSLRGHVSGLTIMVTNNMAVSHCFQLQSILEEEYCHSVIVLHDVMKDVLYAILGSALAQVEPDYFNLILTSEGNENALCDSRNIWIPIKELIEHVVKSSASFACKILLLLQTVVADPQGSIELSSCRSLRLRSDSHLVCVHISVASSVLSSFVCKLQEFRSHNHLSVESLVRVTCSLDKDVHWYNPILFNGDYDFCVIRSYTQDVQLCTILCSTKMAFSLGRLLYSRRDKFLQFVQSLPAIAARENASALCQHLLCQEGPDGRRGDNQQFLQGVLTTERQLLRRAESTVMAMTKEAENNKTLKKLLDQCLLYVQEKESVTGMMFEAMLNERFHWRPNPETSLNRRESCTVELINEISAHIYREPITEEGDKSRSMESKKEKDTNPVTDGQPQEDEDITFGMAQDDILFSEEGNEEEEKEEDIIEGATGALDVSHASLPPHSVISTPSIPRIPSLGFTPPPPSISQSASACSAPIPPFSLSASIPQSAPVTPACSAPLPISQSAPVAPACSVPPPPPTLSISLISSVSSPAVSASPPVSVSLPLSTSLPPPITLPVSTSLPLSACPPPSPLPPVTPPTSGFLSQPVPPRVPSPSSINASRHLVLRMVENNGYIEVVPVVAILKEIEDDWMDLSYEHSNFTPVDPVIILNDVESEEGSVEIVPVPVIFQQREDDWIEMSVKRMAVACCS